jgi:TRAP-type uncharacterized transport system fused permease subunit
MFVFGTPLILIGNVPEIILAVLTACIGSYLLAVGLMGYQFANTSLVFRLLYIVCALLTIMPGWRTDLAGLAVGCALSFYNFGISKKQKPIEAAR